MSQLPFSNEHRARFRDLSAVGEVYAVNLHKENLYFGPWLLGCDSTDLDTAYRLKERFRAATQKGGDGG